MPNPSASGRNELTAPNGNAATTTILMPLFEDWTSCRELLIRLDDALATSSRTARVFIVDDASRTSDPAFASGAQYRAISLVEVLSLRRNLGHQRAIAVGLAYLDASNPSGAVVVMDSDGEDSPYDVPLLLDALERDEGAKVVFAERTRRSEGVVFSAFYALFRFTHRLLTGQGVRVGSFSALSARALRALVVVPEIWNHYAAAVFISRLRYSTIPTSRAKRIAGESKMGFVRLVMHGLSAISVFSDVISVRVLLAAGSFLGLATLVAIIAIGGWIYGSFAVPAWAVSVAAVLTLAILQALAFVLLFTFTVLSSRKGAVVLLARDYGYYIDEVQQKFP